MQKMDNTLEFLQSRPLIGFQMDGSHLNNVLQDILRTQQQLQNTQRLFDDRISGVEGDIKEITVHVKDLERAVAELGGGGEKLEHIRARIDDVERGLDVLLRDLNETKKLASDAAQDADLAGQLADQANKTAKPLKDAVESLAADMDVFGRQHAQEQREVARALDELAGARKDQEKRMSDALRDWQARMDHLAAENGVERLRLMLEELSDRTDENFKSVEESARAVDAELTRQGGEFASVRAELSALEDKTRARLVSLSNDVDDRYQALLTAFKEYERNSQELEEHLVKAGQVLARRRDVR